MLSATARHAAAAVPRCRARDLPARPHGPIAYAGNAGPAPAFRIRRTRLVRAATHEGRALGGAVLQQLRGKLVPRFSALAGLAAGWWVTSTYTDSHLRSVMNTVGLGRGGTHVVSGTMYKAMNFWLPILAAAICAYMGDRLARRIGQRQDAG